MKTSYSSQFSPAAPILIVALALRDKSPQFENVTALVDTGADMTIVPTDLIEALDAPQQYAARMRAFVTGTARTVSAHQVDIVVDRTRIPSIDVISDDLGDQVILGRNFLNKFRLVLDGPRQVSEI